MGAGSPCTSCLRQSRPMQWQWMSKHRILRARVQELERSVSLLHAQPHNCPSLAPAHRRVTAEGPAEEKGPLAIAAGSIVGEDIEDIHDLCNVSGNETGKQAADFNSAAWMIS